MNMDLRSFIGKHEDELEKALGFTHYVETEDSILGRTKEINPDLFVEVLLKFAGNQKLKVVKTDWYGIILDIFDISLADARKHLLLLQRDKGMFIDEDDLTYSILGENFYAYAYKIIFFSASEENVQKMAQILDEYSRKYYEPYELGKEEFTAPPLPKSEPPAKIALIKIGRNDPCYCGSGKKYKKCCINKDGGRYDAHKVNYDDEDNN